jgi:putative DNA primase/helicase
MHSPPFVYREARDIETEFAAAMRSAGIEPPAEIVADGLVHRFPVNGERRGKRSGAYRLYGDGQPAGWFQSHKGGGGLIKWPSGANSGRMDRDQWLAYRREMAERAAARALRDAQCRSEAVQTAQAILEAASEDPATHPYAVRKGVPLGDRVRRGAYPPLGWSDALLLPLYLPDGALSSLQAIDSSGEKRFLAGGRTGAALHPIGKLRGAAAVLIGEGLATVAAGASVTGWPAAAAMSAGNLAEVARAVRDLAAPGARITIIADNDAETEGNPGLRHATEAARAIGGLLAVPDLGGRKCDLWDVWKEQGADMARSCIEAATTIGDGPAAASSGDRAGDGWPVPHPLGARIEPEPYPLDALPGTIRVAVEEVAGFVKAPVPMVASSALAALSLAIQGHANVKRAEKLEGPVGLFLLTIADSGERKSTCDGYFSRAIRDYEEAQAEAAKPALKDHNAAIEGWEAKRQGIKEQIRSLAKRQKPTTSMESALRDLEHDKPKPPRIPRLLYADATPEALAYGLAKQWPSGGVVSAEAGIVFGSHGMSKDSVMRNLGLLNQLWDGTSLAIDRRSGESFTVRGARLTVALQVQEPTLREFFTRSGALARGTGFLARFLVAWPESTQGQRPFTDPPANWPHLVAFHERIAAILNRPAPIDEDGALTPPMLPLNPEAKAAWVAYHDAIESELSSGGELYDVRDVASKSADNAARLAALFQMFEGAGGAIGADAFEGASRITAWHLHEARRFFGELALPAELADAARLDRWLIEHCRRERTHLVPTRDAQRLGPIRDKEKLEAALREMEDLDRVRVAKEGRRKTIKVNPALVAAP